MTDEAFDRARDLLKRKLGAREVADNPDDLEALLASQAWVREWNALADRSTVVNPYRPHASDAVPEDDGPSEGVDIDPHA